MEYELLIREAEPGDAVELVTFFKSCQFRDRFYQLDGDGILLTGEEMEVFLNKQASSDNQIKLTCILKW